MGQVSPADPEIKPPQLKDKTTRIKLPATVDDVVIGGAGRYLLYQFQSLKKVGVFDVNEAKITHYISTPDTESKIAAGMNKLVIVTSDGATISRYDIASGERELTTSLDLGAPPANVLLGSASSGPVIVTGGDRVRNSNVEIDLGSLKAAPLKLRRKQRFSRSPRKISANGKTLTCWGSGSPSGLETGLRIGNEWETHYEHTSVGAILPSPNGRTLFTASRIYSSLLRPYGALGPSRDNKFKIPAAHGQFYLSVPAPTRSRRRSDKEQAVPPTTSLHMVGDNRALATIDLESVVDEKDRYGRGSLLLDQRYILLPRADLIVQLATTNDEVILTQFNISEALASSDIDFLFVQSQPPNQIAAGKHFEYQIKAQSKGGDLSYSLAAGPEGMKISKSGLVTWSTSRKSAPDNSIITTVTDKSGQEIFHVFDVTVIGGKGTASASKTNAVFSEDANVTIAESPLDETEKEKIIKLPGTIGEMAVGGGGRYILVHFKDLKKIGVFDVTKAQFSKYIPAADDRTLIVAGANHLLVISQNQGVISRYNLTTFERELTRPIPFPGTISFAGMGNNSYGPMMVRWSSSTGGIDPAKFAFVDLKTLDEKEVKWPQNRLHTVYRDTNQIMASSDGKVFAVRQIGPLRLSGNNVELLQGKYSPHSSPNLTPSADGRFFVSGTQIFNDKLIPTRKEGNQNPRGLIVPAVSGQYYLSITSDTQLGRRDTSPTKGAAKLYLFGDSRPIVSIPDLTIPPSDSGYYTADAAKNLLFIPDAKVIVSASSTLDSLVLKRFDLEEALTESGIDYLVVTSVAPKKAKIGQVYNYQLETLSKKGGLTFKLDAGPAGMRISDKGKITWKPPRTIQSVEEKVIVTIRDAAQQEMFHTFSIEIPSVKELAAAKQKAAKAKRKAEVQARRQLAAEQKAAAFEQRLAAKEIAAAEARKKILTRVRNSTNSGTAAEGIASSKTKSALPVEAWTDTTGKHTMSARFASVQDESKVVLELENGTTKTIPLEKLTAKHIYRAVRYDLEQRGKLEKNSPSSKSPFEDGGGNSTVTANPVDDQLLVEIVKDVERMIKITKTEKDNVKFLRGILFPPELAKKMERDEGLKKFKARFSENDRQKVLDGLLSIDFLKLKLADGIVSFGSPTPRLQKHEGTWYLKN